MGCSVRELLQRVDSLELAEWVAFNSIDPIDGRWRGDLQAGIVASTIANCNRTKTSKTYSPLDFMPMHDKQVVEPQTEDEMKAAMRAIAKQVNT